MKKIIYYILVLIIHLASFSVADGQKGKIDELEANIEDLELSISNLNKNIEKYKESITDLETDIKDLTKSSTDFRSRLIETSKPSRSYKSEYEQEQEANRFLGIDNKKLNGKNRALSNKISRLEAEMAELKRLLAIEIRKVENLEYEKQQLETEMAVMEIRIDDLEVANRDLNSENRKLDIHVDKLQRDSIKKETKIAKQGERIVDLEADKVRLLENRTVLRDLAKKQKNQIAEIKDKHKIDKVQLVSSYLGINYNLTSFNNPIISNNDESLDRGILPNISLSWYNSIAGGYFSIPYNYCNTNPFAKCIDCELETYFTIRDIESAKMAMDIKGIYYEDLSYTSTENHFKTYSAGFHAATMRFLYISLGASVLRGCSWDLYDGDLTGFEGILTPDDVVPIKNNEGFYVLNYENLNMIKPSAGIAFVAPFQILRSKRSTNKQIRSSVLSSYNYKSGFQVEVGYDWLFQDYYAKVGLHFKLWNYDQNILDKQDYYNLAENEVRRGLAIVLDENSKKEPQQKEIDKGLKIIVESIVGRSVYKESEAEDFIIKGEFDEAKKIQKEADDLADLACCLRKIYDTKNESLTCETCEQNDIDLLLKFLPDSEEINIGGKNKKTVIYESTLDYFNKLING